jgi:hypothetical protein
VLCSIKVGDKNFSKKLRLFLKTLLTVVRVAAYIPLTNEGGAPLATTSCALGKFIEMHTLW